MAIVRLPVQDNGTISMREHQARMTEVGRIRLGFFNPEGKGRPQKLDRFRFTSTDGDLIAAVAEQYGGTPGQYTPQRGTGVQWEVISQVSEVPVYVPQQRIDPWLEAWRPGMAIRRCDGVTETISGEDCPCALRKIAPKDRCKPTVRVQLMLAEVPGLGTWRLESHGAYAAGELATLAPLIAVVPMPVPAKLMLRMESRSWVENGERKNTTFYVPWLHISAATPSQMMLGGDALSQALSGAARVAALEAAPEPAAITMGPVRELTASPTPPATPPATPPVAAEPVRLTETERTTILAKIEEATTVDRLKEIAGKLVARGVKDDAVKAALKSKAAAIAAALEVGGSAPGPADTPRASVTDGNAEHQRALRQTAVRAADPSTALDLCGMTREQFGDMQADPQWQECLSRGAQPQEIINEGGPAHWLASDDQSRDYTAHEAAGAPEDTSPIDPWPFNEDPAASQVDPDVQYPVGSQVEVGGITFTKHTAVADTFPADFTPPRYDTDEEFALIYPAAGPFGWTTTQTNDWIKKFCGVQKVGEATGAQLHALRMAMKNTPEQFR